MRRLAAVLVLGACSLDAGASVETTAQPLSAAVKQERASLIRDSAAEMGIYNAALFGGIAVSETSLAHCWSEATYACMGPASPSCGGEPIIAGSADGPCSAEQGGLGMFQFDAGTYAQTLATYGPSILTVEGNTAQAVAFVVERVKQDVDGVTDWASAAAWINSIPMDANAPLAQEWGRLMACRYNGCCSGSATCTSRANGYRDNAIDLYGEFGAAFWTTADRCDGVPDDGIIDERTPCYVAGGDPRFWKREATGFGDDHETTGTTDAATPANFARWIVEASGPVRLEVFVPEANEPLATTATYRIVHAGVIDTVTVDQSAATGFVELGVFDLAGTSDEYVELADNTGVAEQRLAFDALRATDPDGGPPGGRGDLGGCSAARGASAWWLGLALLSRRSRRRRRCRAA